MLLDGRTVARSEFAEKLEPLRRTWGVNGAAVFRRRETKSGGECVLATAFKGCWLSAN